MSLVVAIKKDGVVYMGADNRRSIGKSYYSIETEMDKKLQLINEGNIIIGSVGTVPTIQVMLRLAHKLDRNGKPLTKKHIIQNVIPEFYMALKEEGKLDNEKGELPDTCTGFVLTDGKKIFEIDNDLTVTEVDDCTLMGCTRSTSYAFLRCADKDASPRETMLSVLRHSSYRNDGVGAPYYFIDTKNKVFEIVEK